MARLIRDWTDSERINSLSWNAEVLFTRIMMKADDYGSYHANPQLLKGVLFPLKPTVRSSDISLWLEECKTNGLVVFYTDAGKRYLRIVNFGQRLRNMRNKFPDPPPDVLPRVAASCRELPPEVEKEVELELEQESVHARLFEIIKNHFGFINEQNHIHHWKKIHLFIKNLEKENKIEHFQTQFEFYKKYKVDGKEKLHGFENFLSDGWNSENWKYKYEQLLKSNHKEKPVYEKFKPPDYDGVLNRYYKMKYKQKLI